MSKIIISYFSFKISIISPNLSLSKASEGLFGIGPETKISKFSISDSTITSLNDLSPSIWLDIPISFVSPKSTYILGLLKSAPTTKVFLPDFAKTIARF